jgi:hypothetical protein
VTENEQLVDRITTLFQQAYRNVIVDWEKAQRYADKYDRVIDYGDWNTMSELVIPTSYIAVEVMMPTLVNYLFPKTGRTLSLIPRHEALPIESVEAVEEWLEDLIRWKTRFRQEGYLTLKDCVKLGTGYGIIEPKSITTDASFLKIAQQAGEVLGQERVMGLSEPQLVESYRYAPFGSVIPMPGGYDPDNCPGLFFLDFKTDYELNAMYQAELALPEEQRVYMGDPGKIIQDAIDGKTDGSIFPVRNIMANIAGYETPPSEVTRIMNSLAGQKSGQVLVPILCAEFPGEHVWLANGKTIMYHQKGQFNSLKSRVVKASGSPDSGRWFTPGIIEPGEDLDSGINTFYNALLDILTYYLHPARIINKRALVDQNEAPNHEPWGDIMINGDPKQAVSHVPPPPLPGGMMSFGDILQQFNAQTKGQPLAQQGVGGAGVVRGGIGAFESMLQGSFARDKLFGATVQTGWMEASVIRFLSLTQQLTTWEGRSSIVQDIDEAGKRKFRELRVTPDEVRHSYDVRVDLDSKYLNEGAEEAMRLQKFGLLRNDPFTRPRAAREWLLGSKEEASRLLYSEAEAEQIAQEIRQLAVQQMSQELAARELQQMQAEGGPEGGATRAEQAMMGGASQAEGLQV